MEKGPIDTTTPLGKRITERLETEIAIWLTTVDPDGKPVELSIHNDETNKTETVSRFAVRVPMDLFDAVRKDKASNGIVQNARMAEKRRGFIEPEFRMPVLEGRITRW